MKKINLRSIHFSQLGLIRVLPEKPIFGLTQLITNCLLVYRNFQDHILYFNFFFSNNPNTTIWVNWFGLPFLQTRITQAQKETFITLSDHEPVISTINLKKWK